ncbi:MAG: InlB B-repeat-containing protein [Clostridia bacterium]|nr:InlB B-repeat-containing protein [Clostridia bacterium]MBQ4154310.1 InlB B-repeat-containing protein [Clostridia bacterium]
MKKALSILVCFVITFNLFSVSALADTTETRAAAVQSEKNYESYDAVQTLEDIVDIDEFEEALFNGFYYCSPTVDISDFNIRETTANVEAITEFIFNEMPENFHISSFYYWRSAGRITAIEPEYEMSASTYQRKYREFIAARDELLSGIKNNYYLDDVQKALLIHDRLALVCEYDFNGGEYRYDSYGAMVVGSAVCQGYTEAYDYLLEEVGIESYACSSDALNHIWNIVYINNRPYHVDVTWDDFAWDDGERGAVGVVGHENFLRSSNGIYSAGHTAYDYDTFPTSTTYDNYFWHRSESAFQLIDNEIYYVDNVSGSIKRYSDRATLYTLTATWKSPGGRTWQNQSRLASDGNYLYCSLNSAVYRCDVSETSYTQIYSPSLSSYESIYGFEYTNGYLVCDINTAPPEHASMSSLYQLKYAYTPPSTGASASVLTANSSYNASITIGGQEKYYVFTPSTSGTYVIYSTGTDDYEVSLYDAYDNLLDSNDDYDDSRNFRLEYNLSAGTQYKFGVQYYSSSKTGTIPFKFGRVYTITYNANGGSGAPSPQKKDYGKTAVLSNEVPVKGSYSFKGWATSSSTSTVSYQAGDNYNIESDITLYAVWGNGATALSANYSYNADISVGDQVKYYTFTPSTSGTYVIYSSGNYDTVVYLYNASGTEIAYNDDGGESTNFRLEYNLTAGTMYKFGVRYYSSSKTGTIPFKFGRVYTVTYNANGGSGAPSSQKKDYGKSITISDTVPVKSGHIFKGWGIHSAETTATYMPGSMYNYNGDITLYAIWQDNHTHTFRNYTTPATTTSNGKIVKKCTSCGYVESQSTIRKIGTIALSSASAVYNGKARTPGVVVKNSAGTTIASKYYTVSYQSGRKNVGRYKVTIKFKGYYSGTRNLYFTITPPKTAISKLTAGKKSFTVKVAKKSSQVTGYQIQYATYRNFKNAKSKTISSYKTTSYTLKNLTARKTYYVRVRTYRKTGGKNYYSPWSSYKTVKTK